MKRRAKKTVKKSSRGLSKKRPVTDLIIGGLLANVVSKLTGKFASNMVPMANILVPAGIAVGANFLRPPYADGMIVGAALTAVSEAIKTYAPPGVANLLAGDEYVIQGTGTADPLLGAAYLMGENEDSNSGMTNPLDNTDFVISGIANDPLD